MIVIALALGGLQVLCVILAWLVSPVRPLAYLACLLWVLGCVVLVRHRNWVAGLSRPWRRWLCLLVWQLPGLSSGACALAIFSGLWQAPAIAVFLLQLWLQPLAPLIALAPRATCHAVADYLWVAALIPFLGYLVTAVIAMRTGEPEVAAPATGARPD
jgi:hypothetical protein